LLEVLAKNISRQQRVNYLIRTTRPEAIMEITEKFDEKILSIATSKLRIKKNSVQFQPTEEKNNDENSKLKHWDLCINQLTLPIRCGGFGLTSTQLLSPIAYYSSLASAIENSTSLKLKQHSVSKHAGNLNSTELKTIDHCISLINP